MKKYYVYILECSNHSYYTGVTNNIERRINEHQHGLNLKAFTFNKRTVKLVYVEEFAYIKSAIAFEKQVKGWSRKKKEALIKRDFVKLKELAQCKNLTSHLYFDSAQYDKDDEV